MKKMMKKNSTTQDLNKVLISNVILIILLVLVIGIGIYATIRLDKEGVVCVNNPIKYYEKTYNVTIPRLIKEAAGISPDINFSEITFTFVE